MDRVAVVIPAAGLGQRMGYGKNKAFLPLNGLPLLVWTVKQFAEAVPEAQIVVVVREEETVSTEELLTEHGLRAAAVIAGGATRQQSVWRGLRALPPDTLWTAIHDGARPLVTQRTIAAAFQDVKKYRAVGVAVPVKDTLKEVAAGVIVNTPDRQRYWQMQTPQVFQHSLILQAHEEAAREGRGATDDCALVEALNVPVHIVLGEYSNIKITTPEDKAAAEAFLPKQDLPASTAVVGFGYDVHAFVSGRPLLLCGVQVPYERGLDGHSDADAAVHAVMDALLGAAGLGDIGRHFPDTDPRYRGADSMALLRSVMAALAERHVRPINVDVTVAAQEPKLAPYIEAMKQSLARGLGLPQGRVNVKATTTEKLGFVGEKRGIAAYAVVSATAPVGGD